MPHRADKELIEGYQKGDIGCFDELILKHKHTIFNFCFSVVGNYHDTKVVAQSACMTLQKSLKKFVWVDAKKFRKYLYRVCKTRSINRINQRNVEDNRFPENERLWHVKQIGKKPHYNDDDDAYVDHRDKKTDDPRKALERKETKKIMNDAFLSMQDSYREMLTLLMEGYELDEIAEEMNISYKAAKSLKHRAKNEAFKVLYPKKDDLLW